MVRKDFWTDPQSGAEYFEYRTEVNGLEYGAQFRRDRIGGCSSAPLDHIDRVLRRDIMREIEAKLFQGVK